ncbi:hypothetical protein ACEPAF_765 [Sanghuangporus sanghuang]
MSLSLKMNKLTDLTGKVTLVTKGDTEVGLMIAKGLASKGAKVYITGRRLNEPQKIGLKVLVTLLQMEVTVKESILSVVDKIKKADGKLDILIRSSYNDTPASDQSFGTYACHLFDIQSFEGWGSLAQTNHARKEDATASVINIASGAGQIRLSFGYFAYASLKVGTSLLTRLLATDFALKRAPIRPSNIRKDCKCIMQLPEGDERLMNH